MRDVERHQKRDDDRKPRRGARAPALRRLERCRNAAPDGYEQLPDDRDDSKIDVQELREKERSPQSGAVGQHHVPRRVEGAVGGVRVAAAQKPACRLADDDQHIGPWRLPHDGSHPAMHRHCDQRHRDGCDGGSGDPAAPDPVPFAGALSDTVRPRDHDRHEQNRKHDRKQRVRHCRAIKGAADLRRSKHEHRRRQRDGLASHVRNRYSRWQ